VNVEENKAVVRRYVEELFNAGDLALRQAGSWASMRRAKMWAPNKDSEDS